MGHGESLDRKEQTRRVVLPWKLHKEGQRSPWHVLRPEDCLAFFWIRSGFNFLFLGLSGVALSLGSRGSRLVAVVSGMTGATTEHAEVEVKAALSFNGE